MILALRPTYRLLLFPSCFGAEEPAARPRVCNVVISAGLRRRELQVFV